MEEKLAHVKRAHILRCVVAPLILAFVFAAIAVVIAKLDKKDTVGASARRANLYHLYTRAIFENMDILLKSWSPNYFSGGSAQTEIIDNIMRSRAESDRFILFLAVTDKNKNILRSFSRKRAIKFENYKDFVIDPVKKDVAGISEPVFSQDDNAYAVSLTRTAYGKDGRIAGYISVFIDLEEISKMYEGNEAENDGTVTSLLNRAGKIMARTRDISKYFNTVYEDAIDRHMLYFGNADGEFSRNLDGESTLVSTREIEEFGMTIVAGVLITNIYDMMFVVGGSMLVVWLVFSTAIYFISAQIYKNDMAFAVENMEYRLILQGKLNTAVKLRAQAEKHQKEQETILIEKTKMSALSDLMISVAHQWRQPLNSLALCAQDIMEEFKTGNMGENYLREITESMIKDISYLSKTIDNFSKFFAPEEEKTEFDAASPALEAINIMREYFESLNIKFSFSHPDKPIIVSGFERDISRAILNILTNAKDAIVKKNKNGGKVDVSVYKEGGFATIDIKNDGGGVSEEHYKKLFEPYFTTKHKSKGVGLGLYTAKIAVEDRNGGKISAENFDKGMSFTIRLPALDDDLTLDAKGSVDYGAAI